MRELQKVLEWIETQLYDDIIRLNVSLYTHLFVGVFIVGFAAILIYCIWAAMHGKSS